MMKANLIQLIFGGTLCCATLLFVSESKSADVKSAETKSATTPNIVLMMADDLGWGDLGYMGNKEIRTPHLDQMASQSLRFQRFYAAAPVCSPTRGSCITGRNPFRYGIFSANVGHMLPHERTLGELLQEKGYATGHFGKWHLGTLTKTEQDANRGGPKNVKHFAPPDQHGFDEYFSTESKVPTWDPLLRPKGNNSRTWWNAIKEAEASVSYGTAYWSNGKKVTENTSGDDSRVIMDRAIPFIRNSIATKKPFFVIVWFHAPHLPVVAGPKYAAMYQKFPPYKQHYYGCITALDEQVGRLRETLKELNVADDTLVCFTSDNGPEGQANNAPGSAAHLRGRKRDLYEGGIRVPGLIEWPAKITEGRETKVPAFTSDYLPTILDITEISVPDNREMDGISLLPLFNGTMKERPAPIAFQFGNQATLIDNQYKLISEKAGKSKKDSTGMNYALYDLLQDESEKDNIAEKHVDLVTSMSQKLEAWQKSCANDFQQHKPEK